MLQLTCGRFWANNHTHILRGTEVVSTEYLHLVLSRYPISGLITGTAQPKITQANMNRIPVLVGDPETHKRFNQVVRPLFDLSDVLRKSSANLRTQRDFLLPRLISGEIDVSQAAEMAQEAAE
jgi:type I restriction enzyme, S subunit